MMFYLTSFGSRKNKPGFHLVSDNWNDFGYYTLFNLFYLDESLHETKMGYVKIGYIGQDEGTTELSNQFDYLPANYFSLGQSANYYSQLRSLGDELRKECLEALNDLAFSPEIYDEVSDEKVVSKSLLRDLYKKIVTTQFRRIAHGGAILTEYDFNFKITSDDKSPSIVVNVMPESLPPTNIHTIIGTNGSGKTTTLKGIIDGYLDETLDVDFSNAIFISFSVFDKNGIYESNNEGKDYFYVGVKTYDAQTKSQKDLKIEFRRSIKNILTKKRYSYLHRMLKILNADYNLNNFKFINILEQFMDSSRNKEEIIRCSILFSKKFDVLSSGHQIILLSITKIVELIVEKTLILIDEPETHLHPPLLSAFIRAISEITITENAVAILATHSPVVLQEVPKSCVSIIRKYGKETTITRPRFETFGENLGVLTEEVFGLEIPKTGFHSLLRSVVEKTPDFEEVLSLFNHELSIEAKSVIRTHLNEMKEEK